MGFHLEAPVGWCATVTVKPNGLHTCVRQDQQPGNPAPATRAFAFPPGGDGMGGEGRRIVRDADTDGAAVVQWVVNAVGDAHTAGIGGEVVIVHQNRRAIPFGSGVLEIADQFAFLAIGADEGKTLSLETSSQRVDLLELLIPVGSGIGGDLLAVDAQREVHFDTKDEPLCWPRPEWRSLGEPRRSSPSSCGSTSAR